MVLNKNDDVSLIQYKIQLNTCTNIDLGRSHIIIEIKTKTYFLYPLQNSFLFPFVQVKKKKLFKVYKPLIKPAKVSAYQISIHKML